MRAEAPRTPTKASSSSGRCPSRIPGEHAVSPTVLALVGLCAAPVAAKDTVEPFGAALTVETENFALHWGGADFSEDEAGEVLSAFETARTLTVADDPWPAPTETADHRINLYVGSSAANLPLAAGRAYTDTHDDGRAFGGVDPLEHDLDDDDYPITSEHEL